MRQRQTLPFILAGVTSSWRRATFLHPYWREPFHSMQDFADSILQLADREKYHSNSRQSVQFRLGLLRLLCEDPWREMSLSFDVCAETGGSLSSPSCVLEEQCARYAREISRMTRRVSINHH
jgi:hypothetical protein